MGSLIGFTISAGLSEESITLAKTVQTRALTHFSHLGRKSFQIGKSQLDVWGYDDLNTHVYTSPDGSAFALIGSPVGEIYWRDVEESLLSVERAEDFELPWDGRVILLRVSADGRQWTVWNDWLGSIPIFYAQINQGRIASTLEPVVVAGGGYTSNDIFIPGLLYLFIHGSFISDWTLYKQIKVMPPDCVSVWDEKGFRWQQYFSVKPTDERWERGWDELVDEMAELSRQAISDALKAHSGWILPLSSGLDSRLIAAVGAELGVNLHAYSWGRKGSKEIVGAQKIAHALGIPWTWVDIGADYLVKYARLWADMFGSAMHFHGMYQMPFLEKLKSEPPNPIVSGFLGDTLAGYDVRFQSQFHSSSNRLYQAQPDGYTHWSGVDFRALFKFPVDDALEQVASEIAKQRNAVVGPWFQSLRFLTLWGRQRYFTYFQSVLCDYWRGVTTPYLNRDYARFCLSLPRCGLEERRLQGDVFRRYYGLLATIPGSYSEEPFIYTGRYLLKRRISKLLPESLLLGPFQEFDLSQLSTDIDCVRKNGRKSFWPLFESTNILEEWLNMSEIEKVYESILAGDEKSLRKLQSVQTLAYRLFLGSIG